MTRPIKVIQKYIDIIVYLDSYANNDSIAASTDCKANVHPISVKKENQLTDTELELYRDFITTLLQIICRYKIKLEKHYQSNKSYAYYIPVVHYGFVDNEYVKYDITFRIAAHSNHTFKPSYKKNSAENNMDDLDLPLIPIIKEIRLGSHTTCIYNQAQLYMNKVCKGIQEDDQEILKTDFKIFN